MGYNVVGHSGICRPRSRDYYSLYTYVCVCIMTGQKIIIILRQTRICYYLYTYIHIYSYKYIWYIYIVKTIVVTRRRSVTADNLCKFCGHVCCSYICICHYTVALHAAVRTQVDQNFMCYNNFFYIYICIVYISINLRKCIRTNLSYTDNCTLYFKHVFLYILYSSFDMKKLYRYATFQRYIQ